MVTVIIIRMSGQHNLCKHYRLMVYRGIEKTRTFRL